jgi:hypothetical protein
MCCDTARAGVENFDLARAMDARVALIHNVMVYRIVAGRRPAFPKPEKTHRRLAAGYPWAARSGLEDHDTLGAVRLGARRP